MTESPDYLRKVYSRRFTRAAAYRNQVWRVLAAEFFSKWIHPQAAVLDLGCGFGEFSNNVIAARKWAMDLNPDARARLNPDVQLLAQDCSSPWQLGEASLDVVFTSNFLEHLPDKAALRATLQQAFRCLRPGGRLIAMGPNIKYAPGAYWDFFDHYIPLTELSLGEALEVEGFQLESVTARFLPLTMVNAPEYPMFFLRAYLRLPWIWPLLGRQFLLIARRLPDPPK